jgi:hypothetical protein
LLGVFVGHTAFAKISTNKIDSVATNLLPPAYWERIGTTAADNLGIFQISDTNAPAFSKRVYRAFFP